MRGGGGKEVEMTQNNTFFSHLNLNMVGRWSDLRDWLEVFSSTKVTTHVFQKIKYYFADLFVCLFFW